MSFQYMLRLTIAPGFHETEKLAELVRFCQEAMIDDVMFFNGCGEIDQGHATQEEMLPWLETVARAREALRTVGSTTSLNPLMTLRHFDQGRALKPGQSFELMVDRRGLRSTVTPCPLCPAFGDYLAGMFALYASATPAYVWVEDDFRLHNHAPLEWGGCFCERHMAEFSRRAGSPLTREQFVSGMLAPGQPHPYRSLWLEVARDSMTSLARRIGDAVHEVSPATRVGLMSSDAAVHCAEGRDWGGILTALSGPDHPPILRPHLPAYREPSAPSYLIGFSESPRQTRAFVPRDTECYPELENYPHSLFTQSRAFSQFQITSALSLGASGITMNIFDMMGNGVLGGRGFESMLAQIRPFCDSVAELAFGAMAAQGVRVPVSPMSSATLHTQHGERLEELYPAETLWSGVLSSYGIANTVCSVPATQLEGGCVAVSGQYFRNLTPEEISRVFETSFVIMDGDALHTLLDMGLGELAGISGATWRELNAGRYTYEQVCDGKRYCGQPEARISLQETGCSFLDVEYSRAPELKTMVKDPSGENAAAGIAVVEGRVLVFPYGRYAADKWLYLQHIRQAITQDALRSLNDGRCPPFVIGRQHLSLDHFRNDDPGRSVLYLTNWSLDDAPELRLHCPGAGAAAVEEISVRGRIEAACHWCGDTLILGSGLARLESKALLLRTL